MATVSRDRGQLILVGALALAISLVAIALVLNSAIYTHNLASRYDGPADDAATFDRDARIAAGGMVEYANENRAADGYDDVVGSYTNGLETIDDGVSHRGVVSGRVRHVRHVDGSTTEGIRVADLEQGGSTFQPADGTPTRWNVTADANVRQFEMVVNRSSLEQASKSDLETRLGDGSLLGDDTVDPLTVEFDDGSDTYRAAVTTDAGDTDQVNVTVYDTGTGNVVGICTASQSNVTVDWTGARVAGEPCEPLTVVENLDDSYTIRYYYGDMVRGGYELVGDRVVDGASAGTGPFTDAVDAANYDYHCGDDGAEQQTYNSATGTYPIVSPAIYDTNITTTYDGPDATYESTQRVAPGEIDPPTKPRITSFTVAEHDSNDDDFVVDWAAAEADDSLDEVVVTNDAEDQVASLSSPGTVTLSSGGTYTFELTVEDADGNSRSATQTHHDDGDESGCPA